MLKMAVVSLLTNRQISAYFYREPAPHRAEAKRKRGGTAP